MAHVQKRGSRWRARYRGPDGRERSRTFARKRNAESWLIDQEEGGFSQGAKDNCISFPKKDEAFDALKQVQFADW